MFGFNGRKPNVRRGIVGVSLHGKQDEPKRRRKKDPYIDICLNCTAKECKQGNCKKTKRRK